MSWQLPEVQERTLGKLLRRQAEHVGDDTYLMFDSERYTFAEVNERSNSFAHGFRKLGVTKGSAVACYLENSLDFVLVAFALGKLGGVYIPTNVDFKGDYLTRTFVQGNAAILLVDEALVPRVAEIWDQYRFRHVLVRGSTEEAGRLLDGATVQPMNDVLAGNGTHEPLEIEDVRHSDLSAVLWTSGTTGPPKGVMQSHNLWIVDADYMARKRDGRPGDVYYSTMPMYQSGAWIMNIYTGLVTGLPVGLDPYFSVSQFWERCRFYGATQIFTLGAMHVYLWQAAEQPDDSDNPVRAGCCIPMPAAIHEGFKARFGIEYICEGFGQSECMPWSMTDPSRAWKPNSCGVARDDIEVKILDEDDREVPTGETGEVCIRPREPDVIFSGYYRDPEATVAAWKNLWYHSGDLGRIDADGEFFFVDRKADFMRHKGRNISSFEVESVAAKHPAVSEVAAHAIPAAELESEDEIKLCVVLREGAELTAETLAAYVNENAPYYMVPRYIEFFAQLPHTPTGRVQKYKLRWLGVTENTWDREQAGFLVRR